MPQVETVDTLQAMQTGSLKSLEKHGHHTAQVPMQYVPDDIHANKNRDRKKVKAGMTCSRSTMHFDLRVRDDVLHHFLHDVTTAHDWLHPCKQEQI